jgi:hypothetical protein
MRTFSRWMALAVLVCGPAAYADRNDLQITQLGNPNPGGTNFKPEANGDFRAFTRTVAAALTSANLMPPETLGHAGFAINAELGVISLPSSVVLPTERTQTDTLLLPSAHFRKGLPFSFELGARVGWVDRSRLFAATGELKWAVNEGFTWLPDIGVRAHVTRLMGNNDFDLTAAGLDLGVGKQFPLGGMVTLTPYGGLDLLGVAASANNVHFRPDRPYEDTLSPDAALADTASFAPIGLADHVMTRIYGGARFIGGVLQLGAEISITRVGSVPTGVADESRHVPAVLALNTTLGLDF